MKGWVESEVSMLRSPQATTCMWDSSRDCKMKHRFETEEDGALRGRYIQTKAKEDKEDFNHFSMRTSSTGTLCTTAIMPVYLGVSKLRIHLKCYHKLRNST